MQIHNRFFSALKAAAAVTLFSTAGTLGLQAQQNQAAAAPVQFSFQPAAPMSPTLLAANEAPDSSALNYSSSAGASETASAESYSLSAAAKQPPPRRYGRRPVYADRGHNADGSNKYGFLVGGGLTLPTGGSHAYLATSYSFQGGIIRNFNKNFGVAAQFDWDNFAFQHSTLTNQLALYDQLGATDSTGAAISTLGGNSHVWSLTLDPTYSFFGGEKSGAYVVAGVGFYHKTANFTTPGVGEYCDPYYGCYEYEANETIDDYTSNGVGVNAGFGFTYKPSRFGNEKFYAEARYVFMDNQPRPYDVSGTTSYFNAFPENSRRTTYIPIKFGLRF